MCMTFYLIKCILEFIFMQFYTLGTEWLIFIYWWILKMSFDRVVVFSGLTHLSSSLPGLWPSPSEWHAHRLHSKQVPTAWPLYSSEVCRQQDHFLQGKRVILTCACVSWELQSFDLHVHWLVIICQWNPPRRCCFLFVVHHMELRAQEFVWAVQKNCQFLFSHHLLGSGKLSVHS